MKIGEIEKFGGVKFGGAKFGLRGVKFGGVLSSNLKFCSIKGPMGTAPVRDKGYQKKVTNVRKMIVSQTKVCFLRLRRQTIHIQLRNQLPKVNFRS